MSTNKTENYGLHAWVAGDDFLLSEINENFATLDGAAQVVIGSYTGNAASEREIELGFAPKAVLFVNSEGKMGYHASYNYIAGGLILPDHPVSAGPGGKAAEMTENGFRVFYSSYNLVNAGNKVYRYFAFR